MSGSNRFSLDPHKLDALSKADALSLIEILVRNLQRSPSEVCVQKLTLLAPEPEVTTEMSRDIKLLSEQKFELGIENKKKNKKKMFDMSNYHQRHIALHIYYDGAKYLGFASSTGCDTVEEHLFGALVKLRLIESRPACGYSRCGRTDKGVSAVGQVIALRMRSNLPKDGTSAEGTGGVMEEMDYCGMLNKTLPEDIRVLGWSEVSEGFSARFSAVSRTYRYFFLRKDLDLAAMQRAADLLLGDHDFRNLCKMDVANVSNFRREVHRAVIVRHSGGGGGSGGEGEGEGGEQQQDEVWMLEITGVAFLWHMVRCVMAVLLLVGAGRESPEVVTALFDIEQVPAKPEYFMAPELPLVLHCSGFENVSFTYNTKTLLSLTGHFEALFERHHLAAVRVRNVLEFLREVRVPQGDVKDFLAHLQQKSKAMDDAAMDVAIAGSGDGARGGTWGGVLALLRELGVAPSSQSQQERSGKYERNGCYVPLLQRYRADAYDTRIANLRGAKRSRLNMHEVKKEEAAAAAVSSAVGLMTRGEAAEVRGSTADFFKRKRSEGSTTTLLAEGAHS